MRYRYLLGSAVVVVAILGGRAIVMAQRSTPILRVPPDNPNSDPQGWRARGQVPPGTMPSPIPATEPAAAQDDPMDLVESFLTRSRKEADDSINALTREAETLRARLQKVDAALLRWQAVSGALNNPEARPETVLQPASAPRVDAIKPSSERPGAQGAELPPAVPTPSLDPIPIPPTLPDAPK